LALFLLPFGNEAVQRAWLGRGAMLEVLLLAALRNLGLGLGVLAYRPGCARLCALISVFLVLVAAALGEGGVLLALIGLHALAGTCWLMLAYWKGIVLDAGSRRLPWSAAVWVLVVIAVLGAAAMAGPTRAASALAGLMPTSGGSSENDPDARGGVNDGDNEV